MSMRLLIIVIFDISISILNVLPFKQSLMLISYTETY